MHHPRWRDAVHAATERAVEFLLGIHCERGLAISDRFTHGDHLSAEVLEYFHPKRVP